MKRKRRKMIPVMNPTDITQAQPVLVPENAGTVLNVFGDQFTIKLATQQTQGAFTLLELVTRRGEALRLTII